MGIANAIQTSTGEQTQHTDNKKSQYLDGIRAEMNRAKMSIVNLQNMLMNLKATQLLVQQRMNRSATLEYVEDHYSYDKYQTNEHIQGMGPVVNYGGEPDSRINATRNQLKKDLENYEAELVRVGNQINVVSQEIKKQQEVLKKCQEKMTVIGKDAQMYITKDGISKRQYTEVYMLYQIHLKFKYITQDEGGKTAFSPNSQYLRPTTKLIDQFRFYAERNPFVASGELVLELDNPGSDFNKESLLKFLERLRKVMGNSDFNKYDQDTKKYTEQMLTNVMHPFISQNLQRSNETIRVPDATNALRYTTFSPAKTVSTWINSIPGVKTYLAWDSSSYVAAMLTNFNAYLSGLYNMPICEKTEFTSLATQQQQYDSKQSQTEQQSATIFSKEFGKTKVEIDSGTVFKALESMLADVSEAVANKDGVGTPAENISLRVVKIIYKGNSLYHVRILNNATRMVDYLNITLMEGNLTPSQYTVYNNKLTNVLNSVNFEKEELP
jgi:hypothetical protein